MVRITFDRVSKTFSHTGGGARLIREHLRSRMERRQSEVFYALKDVSFQVDDGRSLAVVGGNGAGKSTMLSMVAGLVRPNAGTVSVAGRVAALLQLGSGFHPDLTGKENVFLNAALLGLDRKRTVECFDAIVDFSGIEEFIGDPLRTYSSGMIMRLAFSVAVHVDADILLIDEVLAVGDQNFQAKCIQRVRQMRQEGKTLLFVTHMPSLATQLCDQALWLNKGRVMEIGSPGPVLSAYLKHAADGQEATRPASTENSA